MQSKKGLEAPEKLCVIGSLLLHFSKTSTKESCLQIPYITLFSSGFICARNASVRAPTQNIPVRSPVAIILCCFVIVMIVLCYFTSSSSSSPSVCIDCLLGALISSVVCLVCFLSFFLSLFVLSIFHVFVSFCTPCSVLCFLIRCPSSCVPLHTTRWFLLFFDFVGQVSPFLIPALISNTASGVVAIEHKARGPNFGVVSACATGTHAIGTAMDFMLRGEVRAFVGLIVRSIDRSVVRSFVRQCVCCVCFCLLVCRVAGLDGCLLAGLPSSLLAGLLGWVYAGFPGLLACWVVGLLACWVPCVDCLQRPSHPTHPTHGHTNTRNTPLPSRNQLNT